MGGTLRERRSDCLFVGMVSALPRDGTPEKLRSFVTAELGGNLLNVKGILG